MTAAESRIRDVDVAKAMMSYTKNNIRVQSAHRLCWLRQTRLLRAFCSSCSNVPFEGNWLPDLESARELDVMTNKWRTDTGLFESGISVFVHNMQKLPATHKKNALFGHFFMVYPRNKIAMCASELLSELSSCSAVKLEK